MCFSGATLAHVSPDKMETLFRIFSFTTIYFGADGSDLLIKFGALVTFCVLIDSFGIVYYPEIGANNSPFAFFLIT